MFTHLLYASLTIKDVEMGRNSSRRNFIKIGAAAVAGTAVASTVQVPLVAAQAQQNDQQVSTLQNQIAQETGFTELDVGEQALVESIAETIIPADSNGPGAKEAGVIYFIDRQLAGEYGKSGNMFMQGPFVAPGQTESIKVGETTYSDGSSPVRIGAGTRYQYPLNMREFWRTGLKALQAYALSGFGNSFEKLDPSQKEQVLKDLWANKPTSFNNIKPEEFAYELFMMTWSGFLTDPLQGGNKGLVGWQLLGYNGANFGNAYGEGLTPQQLMLADKPTRLKPASLAQFQASGKIIPP